MKTVTEERTGYASLLICDHPETVCFYRTGQELAIYHKKDRRLEITPGSESRISEYRQRIESAVCCFGDPEWIRSAAAELASDSAHIPLIENIIRKHATTRES